MVSVEGGRKGGKVSVEEERVLWEVEGGKVVSVGGGKTRGEGVLLKEGGWLLWKVEKLGGGGGVMQDAGTVSY